MIGMLPSITTLLLHPNCHYPGFEQLDEYMFHFRFRITSRHFSSSQWTRMFTSRGRNTVTVSRTFVPGKYYVSLIFEPFTDNIFVAIPATILYCQRLSLSASLFFILAAVVELVQAILIPSAAYRRCQAPIHIIK